MPYNRGYRRRYRRRRYYPRRGNGGLDLIKTAKAAYQGVKYLRSIVNVEKHALNTVISETPTNTVGSLACLNLIAQGDAEGNRQGDSVMLKQLHINFKYTIHASASHTTIRTIVFFYKQPQGAIPNITFVLANATHLSIYNHDNVGLYTILYDKSISLNSTNVTEMTRYMTRKFYQIHQTFDGATAAATDIQTNALWVMFVSDEATNTPTVEARAQLMFIDN